MAACFYNPAFLFQQNNMRFVYQLEPPDPSKICTLEDWKQGGGREALWLSN